MKTNNFFNFFKAECKKSIKAMVFLALVGVLIYIVPLSFLQKNAGTTDIGNLLFFVAALCYILPILQNGYKMNKRKVDRVLALPVSKRAIVNVKLLIGLLEILIIYTFLYVLGWGIVAITQPQFVLQYYIPLYFFIAFYSVILYVFNFFITSRANNTFDACVLLILWTFSIYALVNTSDMICSKWNMECKVEMGGFVPFAPFVGFGNFYNRWITNRVPSWFETNHPFHELNILYYTFLPILGLASYLGIYFTAPKDKGECAEEITNGVFGYVPMMVLYLFVLNVLCAGEIFYLIPIGIAMFLVLEFIHQRKFKITKGMLILMMITAVLGFVVGIL